jgi:hypothetical protein
MKPLIDRIIFISSLAQRQLPDSAVKIYCKALLSQLSEEEAVKACDLWINTSKSSQMPTPAALVDLIRPQVSYRGEAIALTNALCKAMAKRGTSWVDSPVYFDGHPAWMGKPGEYHWTWKEACEDYLGPTAFVVVEKMGGWTTLCHSYFEADETSFKAQTRDLIEVIIQKSKAGTLNEHYQLPESERVKCEIASSMIKRLV